jgi:hypothetical protein
MFFPAMKRYNIPRYKSFTDEAPQLPSILENVSITVILKNASIKATEFSSRFGGKTGAAEEKSLAHSNLSFFRVICTTKENLSVSMCVKKVQYY